MGILFLKIVLTLFVVLGITWATERFGGRVGAILSGFPNTMAVILLFYGLENGGEFVAKTIPFGLAGLSAVLVFSATWAYSTNIIDLPIINSFFAITIFAFAVYILQFFNCISLMGLLQNRSTESA
jgi:chromate transport protein ChrA